MKNLRMYLLILILIFNMFSLSGCWNYREIEDLAIVSGLAFDKQGDNYIVTTEIVDIKGGKNSKISTILISSEGTTIFDAVRKSIRKSGKRLYHSHAEIVIISTQLAKEGIIPILDWINRDAEQRYTLHFLVSKEKSAKEILEQHPMTSDILSFELNNMLKSQKNLSSALDIEQWQFLNDFAAMGISATLPTINITIDSDKLTPEITGTALFKEDKLVGFLDGDDTKTLMFIKNKIKDGLLVNKEYKDNSETRISLEIFKNTTKIKPSYLNGKFTFEININTNVAIDEIGGRVNYAEEPELTKLKKDFEATLENSIKTLVKKVQEQYDIDVFGFGKAVKLDMPGVWKKVESQWNDIFKNIDVEVHSTINIKNSALQQKPVKVGD